MKASHVAAAIFLLSPFVAVNALTTMVESNEQIRSDIHRLSEKIKQLELRSKRLAVKESGGLLGLHPQSGPEAVHSGGLVIAQDESFTLTLGGYVRIDLLYTPENIGDLESFTTATIPVENKAGVKQINGADYVHANRQAYFNAKQTRINLSAVKPLKHSTFKAFIEGDFWGTGKFRIRHAYGEFDGVTALGGKGSLVMGQTNSTFTVLASQVNTLDFQGPNSMVSDRYGLIRWRHQPSEWFAYQFGIEESQFDVSQNEVNVSGVDITVDKYDSRYPMLVTALIFGNEDYNIQFSGAYSRIKSEIEVDKGSRVEEIIDGYAINLGGKLSLGSSNSLRYYAVYTKGLGLLIPDLESGFADGVIGMNADKNKVLTLDAFGTMLGLEHFWSDRLSSNLVWGFVNVDNAAGQEDHAFRESNYYAANLIWTPVKQFMFGVEYLYGVRENKDRLDGNASRVQFAAQFNF